MAIKALKLSADKVERIIREVYDAAAKFCGYENSQRNLCKDDNDIYIKIELHDGRTMTAQHVLSLTDLNLEPVNDFVFMDGRNPEFTIEAHIKCMLLGVREKFITMTNALDSPDMLLWKIA